MEEICIERFNEIELRKINLKYEALVFKFTLHKFKELQGRIQDLILET